jgi:hypothetical protein
MSSQLWSFFNLQIFATLLVFELDVRQKLVISSAKFDIWNFINFVGMGKKGSDYMEGTRGKQRERERERERRMGKGIPFFLLLETEIHE